jgi:hypothetical protein
MGRVSRDDNFVPGILLKGSSTGADTQWLGGETSGAGLVELVTPSGDSVYDDTNDAVKVTLATQLDEVNDSILIYANTAKDGTGTSYVPLLDSDGHLQMDILSGSGTEYTEGDTDSTITGKAIMWEDPTAEQGTVTVDATSQGDVPITLGGEVVVISNDDTVSTNNSTTTPLDGDVVYTGTGDDCLGCASITIQLDSSHDSATDGMTFQFSTDNSNWDDVYPFTYTAADGARRFQFPITARYFRIVYTNGNTLQTHFRVQTILHIQNQLTSIHRLVDDVSNDRSAQIVKAAIIAQKAGGGPGAGDFIAIQSTAAGNLKISVQEISDGLDIGAGDAGSETQRVSISTDDVNLSALNSAIVGASAPSVDSYAHIAINLNSGADQLLVSSAANKQIWVYGIVYTCSVAGTVSFQDEDNTAITGIMDHAANSGLSHPASGNFAMPIWKLVTDKDLEVDVIDCAIDGFLDYAIVSV